VNNINVRISYTKNLEEHELKIALQNIKIGKVAGLDRIYQELIKIIGL